MEFTGDYSRCENCGHIYDYNDVCGECGSDNIESINANEVIQYSKTCVDVECYRLYIMLKTHDDLPKDKRIINQRK